MGELIPEIMQGISEESRAAIVDSGALNGYILGYLITAGRRAGATVAQLSDLVRGLQDSLKDTTAAEALQTQRKYTFKEQHP